MSNVILRNERGQLMPATGINGNPKLAGHGLSLLAVKQREQITADLGGEAVLSATDLIRIDEAVRLMQRGRRAKSAEDAVRCSNAAQRIIDRLQARKPPQRPKLSTRERIAAALAELPT